MAFYVGNYTDLFTCKLATKNVTASSQNMVLWRNVDESGLKYPCFSKHEIDDCCIAPSNLGLHEHFIMVLREAQVL